MSDSASSPLLGSQRPTSKQSKHSTSSKVSHEQTPLLSRSDSPLRYDAGAVEEDEDELLIPSPAATSLRELQSGRPQSSSNKGGRRWPTIVAITLLGLVVISIISGVFFAPAVVEEYAKESLVIEPTSLSIDSFTATGVTARIQAVFRMDASRVKNKHVANIGRFGTWLAREVETKPSKLEVYLPEYGNILIGTAIVPRIVVDIRNGHATAIDFLANLEPGDAEGIRRVANDWLDGRLDKVRVLGKADIGLKSGLISLGTQTIAESLVFEGTDIPAIPEYNITRLNIHEVPVSTNGRRGMGADVAISLVNSYPIALTIPPMSFDILVPNCINQPLIRLADATTGVIHVTPYADVDVNVGGIVREMPHQMVQACPGSISSPLDLLVSDYISGNDTTVFVRGSSSPSPETPGWIAALISSVTVPIPFPGHSFDKLIKNFSLTDTKFKFPGMFSDKDESPTVSGNIVVTAGLPKEMNFGINVTSVMATSKVFYHGKKLGDLDLERPQPAKSERIKSDDGKDILLKIQSEIKDAPLKITDDEVLQDILAQYFIGGAIELKIKALVDVEISTVLGNIVVKGLAAEGKIPVKPISTGGGGITRLLPKVGELKVLSTGKTSINLQAKVNFTNPTEYSADVGYVNIHILNNGSIIGEATAKNIKVVTGNNTNVLVEATWDPTGFGGDEAGKIGRELLSQYISGLNTTLTFRAHKHSFAHQPELGQGLSNFPIEIPTPRFAGPPSGNGDDDNDKPHFIDDATFHLLSSSAQFTLISPLQYSTIYIENINATAYYNHTESVGHIDYDLPFKVPPGHSISPKLPVDWSFDSVGYEALKNALGGTLKLDAKGTVAIRLGQWSETVWYTGSGIGASIRL